MKRRSVVVALITLGLAAPAAHADGLSPATGAWKGSARDSADFVSFKVVKKGDRYQARSARLLVSAGCAAPNPNDSTTAREFKARGITINLKAAGKTLRGTRTLKVSRERGKATETVEIAVRFTSARRAKVVVKAKYRTKKFDPTSNADNCTGSLRGTVEPQGRASAAKTVTVGGKGGGRALTINRGDTLKVRLTENPSTGSFWKLTTRPAAGVLDGRGSKFESEADEDERHPIAGAPGKRTFTWKAVGRGTTRIVLTDVPPGRQKSTRGVRYTVTVR